MSSRPPDGIKDGHRGDGNGDGRLILRRTITTADPTNDGDDGDPPTHEIRRLNLMMIACEDGTPYGPPSNTAHMFLDLLSDAVAHAYIAEMAQAQAEAEHENEKPLPSSATELSIAVYRAQLMDDYPCTEREWDSYDGILLPGSLSEAYGEEEWIGKLKDVIGNEIAAKKRKCLAVCFGHQVLAHSFGGDGASAGEAGGGDSGGEGDEKKGEERGDARNHDCSLEKGGRACVCPAGFQFGRREFQLTPEGSELLFPAGGNASIPPTAFIHGSSTKKRDTVQLLYTHGDMVRSLPSCAVSLGGTPGTVPVQAAAYFGTEQEADRFREQGAAASVDESSAPNAEQENRLPAPYAFTFQAHPEYKSRGDGRRTFVDIMESLRENERLTSDELDKRRDDAMENWDGVERDSLAVTVAVGRRLGWF